MATKSDVIRDLLLCGYAHCDNMPSSMLPQWMHRFKLKIKIINPSYRSQVRFLLQGIKDRSGKPV